MLQTIVLIWEWIRTNFAVLAGVGAAAVFLFYERRKKLLEITKLELDIEKLRKEALAYRPPPEEIKIILDQLENISLRKLDFTGDTGLLESLSLQLKDFLTHLLLYYRDAATELNFAEQRLYRAMTGVPQLPSGNTAQLPDVRPVLSRWLELRDLAQTKLPKETVHRIDALLSRFGFVVPFA